MKFLIKKTAVVFLFAALLATVGCGRTDLHHGLDENEANEILVMLHQNGIDARKEKEESAQEVSWKLSIAARDESKSRQILLANNLPRKKEMGLSGVYKDKGLIPTPDEQKARFLLALKGEIIKSLQKIPGVVDVDVVLNVPTENEFSDLDPVKRRPTASVVVKTRNDELVAQTVTEGKVQRFVANTVPNLDPNDVTVIVTRADTGAPSIPLHVPTGPTSVASAPSLEERTAEDGSIEPLIAPADVVRVAGVQLARDSVTRFKFYIISLLLLLVGVSGFLLFNIMRLNRLRLKVQRFAPDRAALGGANSAGLLGEGGLGDQANSQFDFATQQQPPTL